MESGSGRVVVGSGIGFKVGVMVGVGVEDKVGIGLGVRVESWWELVWGSGSKSESK